MWGRPARRAASNQARRAARAARGARARRFVLSQPLVAGAVVGATGEAQLRELAAAAARGALPDDLLQAVDRIHWRYPNPAP
jgi:aryl-alcohol dehydrogenase-like predicted oxidoreductase